MSVYSKSELGHLAGQLIAVEEWLREQCPARHHDDMADVVLKAYEVIDDFHDEAPE
jgi:hypothetical protein